LQDVNLATTQRVVASYPDYAHAQRAVDHLSDEGFPVQHVRIVGEGLRFVEQVTGRKTYGVAAMQGAGSGALIGGVIGFVLGLLSLFNPVVSAIILALWGVVIGAVIGALFGLIGQALSGGRRDFSSVDTVQASRYDVVVDPDHAERAAGLLARMG
jgi:uncharacterized protein YcfJ